MWSIFRRLFGIRSDSSTSNESGSADSQATSRQTNCADTDTSQSEKDSRTFDITECDDIEIEEIDGELH